MCTIPSSISEVFVLIFDGGVGDSGDAVIFLPVVTELTQPVEICVRRHLWWQRKRERERERGGTVKYVKDKNKYSEIVLLFHPPTIVKVLGIIGLSFRLLTCVQQMQNGSNPCRKGW